MECGTRDERFKIETQKYDERSKIKVQKGRNFLNLDTYHNNKFLNFVLPKGTKQSGFVMVFALMIIAICVIIVFQLFDTGTVHTAYLKNMSEREQAKIIAQSGIECALSQLTDKEEPKPGAQAGRTEKQEKEAQEPPEKKFLQRMLPIINRWQTIPLQEKTDGIDGEIKVCICCENGKININEWYNFEKHAFVGQGQAEGDAKKAFQLIFSTIKKSAEQSNLFESFEKFLKQRHYRVNDVTELLALKEFEIFKDAVFFEPPTSDKEKKEARAKMYLTDIFTTWPTSRTIEPWLFSDSVATIFSVKKSEEEKGEEREKQTKELTKNFKPTAEWAQDWQNTLKLVYKKEFKQIPPELTFMLSTKFEPTMFSVLSYGTVGNATHKLYAIIERYKDADTPTYRARVRKVYWL
jgi:hypothetical protein